jgi:hypothetical protein
MKRNLHDTRLVIAIITTVLFILSQALLVGGGWVGGLCMKSLSSPSEGDHAEYTWDSYGIPLEFYRVTTEGWEGCFENQKIIRAFEFIPFVIDVASFIVIGVVLYNGVLLLKRFGQKRTMV